MKMMGMERKLDSMGRIVLPKKARQALGEEEQAPLKSIYFYVLGKKVFLSTQNEETECTGLIQQEAVQTVQNMLAGLPLRRVTFWIEIIEKVETIYFVKQKQNKGEEEQPCN